jgi:hypothetical protein
MPREKSVDYLSIERSATWKKGAHMQRSIDVKVLRYTYDSGEDGTVTDHVGRPVAAGPATFEVTFLLGDAKACMRLPVIAADHDAQLEALRRAILNGITSEAPAE